MRSRISRKSAASVGSSTEGGSPERDREQDAHADDSDVEREPRVDLIVGSLASASYAYVKGKKPETDSRARPRSGQSLSRRRWR
jgi:hypothetical protein